MDFSIVTFNKTYFKELCKKKEPAFENSNFWDVSWFVLVPLDQCYLGLRDPVLNRIPRIGIFPF